jgi:hypothetical protein
LKALTPRGSIILWQSLFLPVASQRKKICWRVV